MSENISKSDVKEDEIDLLDLFRRLGKTISRSFKAIGRAFLISIVFLIRNWLPLGIAIFVGIGLSYILKKTSKPLYSSEISIRSNIAANSDVISSINKLHTFCNESNKVALASALFVNSAKVEDISDIQAYWVIDKGKDGIPDYVDYSDRYNVYDTINVRMKDRFVVRVRTILPQDLSGIRDGIFKYVNNIPLFQEQNKIRLSQIREMINRLGYDIAQLDSLQHIKYFEEAKNLQKPNGGQLVFLQEQKTQLVYPDIYTLFQRKQFMISDSTLHHEVITLLSDFTPPLKPENGLIYYGRKLIPLFFGLTLIILIILYNRKKLFEVYKKY